MTQSKVLAAYLGLAMHAQVADGTATATPAPAAPAVPEGMQAFTFHFRTEKIRDEKGDVIGDGKKLPDVTVNLPVPSKEEVINWIAEGGKESEYLMEVISDAIKLAARGQINQFREDNPEKEVTPDIFDLGKLTFTSIANTPARDRAVDIPEEVFNSFYDDYKTVMTGLGTDPAKVNKHVILFKNQFRTARYDKPALTVLKDRLSMYAAKTENMADNSDVYGFLSNKLDKYLKADEKNLVDAL